MSTHNIELLDAIAKVKPESFRGSVFRISPKNRDPLQFRTSGRGGRWDDGSFPVIYTSLEDATAIAEIRYHLNRQPVFPSKIALVLHNIRVGVDRALRILRTSDLADFGVDPQHYDAEDYLRVLREVYPQTQAVGAALHFLEFDGLFVPSARCTGTNLVLFAGQVKLSPKVLSGKPLPISVFA